MGRRILEVVMASLGAIAVFNSGVHSLATGPSLHGIERVHKRVDVSTSLHPWPEITPSEKLEWHPCYGNTTTAPIFRCARLTVPMDYDKPETSPKVHVALVLLPSNATRNGLSNPQRPSPLLVNPGGPGGSGTQLVEQRGQAMQLILGEEQDVIGFDPRGVGDTTPRADCWQFPCQPTGSHASCAGHTGEFYGGFDVAQGYVLRQQWAAGDFVIQPANSTDKSLLIADARYRAVNKMCAAQDARQGPNILQYASTPLVARDMLSIVDAWDAWQATLPAGNTTTPYPNSTATSTTSLASTKGKLVYWGFSYGSYLGMTFSKLFPDRVGRVVVDGNVNAWQYASPQWEESLHNADDNLANFYKFCFKAGDKCAIFRQGDQSASDIEARVNMVQDRLASAPEPFVNPIDGLPAIATRSNTRYIMFIATYVPVGRFELLAQLFSVLHDRRYGDLTPGMLLSVPYTGIDLFNPYAANYSSVPLTLLPADAQLAIMCSDKTASSNETLAELLVRYERMSKTSKFFADSWFSRANTPCNGWTVPTSGVSGPHPWADEATNNATQVKTAFPMLFLSNTHDPVTPLISGVRMARHFAGAGFMEQLSGGHCTLATASICTALLVRNYFLNGVVPSPPQVFDESDLSKGNWTTCAADEEPWNPLQPGQLARRGVDDHSAALVEALRSIGEGVASASRSKVL